MIWLGGKEVQECPGEGSGMGRPQAEGQRVQRPLVEGILGELELQLDSTIGAGWAGEKLGRLAGS